MRNKKRNEISILRSSAVEYLTFVAASGEGGVEAIYADENVWLSQKMMAVLYDVTVSTINEHLKKIFSDSELEESSVIRKFRITATNGKSFDTKHYNLKAIYLSEWVQKRLGEMIDVSPTIKLFKGETYPFTDIAGNILNQSAILQTQSQNLARQRDLLLPRLMSGKLEVS